ncbi:MAG: TIGR03943 family putative permease subunit [Nocardioides sp.]
MRSGTQELLLTFVGAVLVRLTIGDQYLRYVNDWMRWPILVSGLIIIALSFAYLAPDHGQVSSGDSVERGEPSVAGHSHTPKVAWLLVVPVFVVFLISPPSLGAFQAERTLSAGAEKVAPGPTSAQQPELSPLPPGDPVTLAVLDYYVRVRFDQGRTLVGRSLRLTGFVSVDRQDNWYLTRFSINCCAADATPVRIRVLDAEAPPRNQWVELEGTWTGDPEDADRAAPPIIATEINFIDPPDQQYE